MAKILKCPRCQEKIDVTDLSGGSTVKCEACGTMVRLPSGTSGKVPQAAPPPPPPPAPGRRERGTTKMHKKERGTSRVGAAPAGRQTDLFRKMSNVKGPGEGGRPRGGGGSGEKTKGGNTGMIIAVAAAAVVVLGGVAFAVLSGKDKDHGKSTTAENMPAKKPAKKKDEPKRSVMPTPLPPSDTGVFQAGARGKIDKMTTPTMPNISADGRTAYEAMVSAKVGDVVAQDYTWITYVIDGMLSDNEAVAKGSFEAMHQIINKRKLDASQSELGKKGNIGGFNLPDMRSSEYSYWAQWYFMTSSRNAIAGWAAEGGGGATAGGDPATPKVAPGNASTEPWEVTLRACKSGGFHNSSNPEFYEFQKIKGMGKAAYPHLIRFIDHEDTSLGTTAVLILKELSGRTEQTHRVTDANKAKIKEDWEGWLKSGP